MESSPFDNLIVFKPWYDDNIRNSFKLTIEDLVSLTKSYFKYVDEQKWYVYINGEWKIVKKRLPYKLFKTFWGYFLYRRKDFDLKDVRENFNKFRNEVPKLYYDEEFMNMVVNVPNKRKIDEIDEEDDYDDIDDSDVILKIKFQ
jgi:hypothetical protein